MKTAVLYICHQVDNESMFRYGLLKSACENMGYDIFWMIDSKSRPQVLSEKLPFHEFSLERFIGISNLRPYVVKGKDDITRKNSTGIVATQLFMMDTNYEYDRIWHIEYDVCYIGDWTEFFNKYENVNSDLITAWNYERTEYNFDWYHYKWMEDGAKRAIGNSPFFAITLNCCCRLSRRLVSDVYEFLRGFEWSGFQEWVFPTVANMKGYQTLFFSSPHFRPNFVKGFSRFINGCIYHPLKLNVNLEQILNKCSCK